MKKKWTVSIVEESHIGSTTYYIVKATKETFWVNQDYYLGKYGPSKYQNYTEYELCTPDRKSHATTVKSKEEGMALWEDFVNNTNLIVKHKHEEPSPKVYPETVLGSFTF